MISPFVRRHRLAVELRTLRETVGMFAVTADGQVAIRDSKNPDQPPQCYAAAGWMAFLVGAKDSEFDV